MRMGIVVELCETNYDCRNCKEHRQDECVAYAQKGWHDCHLKIVKKNNQLMDLRDELEASEKRILDLVKSNLVMAKTSMEQEQELTQLKAKKSGEWVVEEAYDHEYYTCSNCRESFILIDGTISDNNYNYCPNCGAKMEKESNK